MYTSFVCVCINLFNLLVHFHFQSQQDEKAKVRNALVEAYIRCLPRVQRKLMFGPDKPAHQPKTLTEGMFSPHAVSVFSYCPFRRRISSVECLSVYC